MLFRGLKCESDAEIGKISADFERGRFEIGSKGSCLPYSSS